MAIDKKKILELRALGMIYEKIAKQLGCKKQYCWEVVTKKKWPKSKESKKQANKRYYEKHKIRLAEKRKPFV